MRKFLALLGVSVLFLPVFAGDDESKEIAPFVDEQTFAIVRVDVSRLDLDAVLAMFKHIGMPVHDQARVKLTPLRDALLKAGVKNVYAVWTLAGRPDEPLLVMKLKDEAAAQALALKLLGEKLLLPSARGTHVVAGSPDAVAGLKKFRPSPRPDLDKALEAVGEMPVQAVFLPPQVLRRALLEAMPRLPKELGNVSSKVLDRGLLWAAAGVSLAPSMSARVLVQSRDADAAMDLQNLVERAFQGLTREAKDAPELPKLLELLTPKTEGDRLVLKVDHDLYTKLMVPLATKMRRAAERAQSTNNLKQIALALHCYHDVYKGFPASATYDKNGKPLLSWRVQILPFVEETVLYDSFHRDEPWDSPHNKKLIERMPKVFRSPEQKNAEPGKTAYLVPTGKDTIFSGMKGINIREITDGTSNTIMVVEVADSQAAIWTKPEDLPVDTKDLLKKLVRPGAHGFNAAFGDGSVRFISRSIDLPTLHALFTRNGGEVIQNVP